MHRTSTATLVVFGLVIGLTSTGFAALTGTGVGGIYAFAILGLLVVGTFLMWPERTRFRTWPSLRLKRSSRRPDRAQRRHDPARPS